MLSAANRWFEENRWAGDAVIAGALLIVLGAASVGGLGWYGGFALYTVLLVLPLFARRTYPLAVLLTTAALLLIQLIAIRGPIAGDVVALVVIHAAAAYIPDRRWGYAALGAGIVGVGMAIVVWSGPYAYSLYVRGVAPQMAVVFLAGVALVVAAYLLGIRHRERAERIDEQWAALAERNRLLTAERDSRVERGAVEERARIARELHDIVAHSLSVIVVQADGGAAAARARPELGPQVLETIAATSRDALAQMRRMVSVLRAGHDDGDGYAPPPGPADLDDLVAQVREAGLPVEFQTIGSEREMTEDAGLAVYRVVQESLTNVLKHAGPAASCRVVLHYGAGEVVVTVTDDGRGAAAGEFAGGDEAFAGAAPGGDELSEGPDPGGDELSGGPDPGGDEDSCRPPSGGGGPLGHGLEGMRERVGLQGGSVHAEPRVGGGFEVTATIPYREEPPR